MRRKRQPPYPEVLIPHEHRRKQEIRENPQHPCLPMDRCVLRQALKSTPTSSQQLLKHTLHRILKSLFEHHRLTFEQLTKYVVV
jgi:hypothetical protein